MSVLGSLLVSPLLGFVLALVLFRIVRLMLRQDELFQPPKPDQPPVGWMRALLILTCTGVSFAHGTNDGQKSIGLIMLTIIGLMPATYALNHEMTERQIKQIAGEMPGAAELIARADGDRREKGSAAAKALGAQLSQIRTIADIPPQQRPALRDDLNQTLAALRDVVDNKAAAGADRASAKQIHDQLMRTVEYAPWWVRVLSALCLGLGTMVGYRRIVTTLGERLGKTPLQPAQGGSAELVAAGLITYAGFGGYPVSTTHVVTGGIAGTMVGSGAGVQRSTMWLIAVAWILTLPATIAISCGLFFLLS
ncbi:fragment of putative low-affinity inorganic phosphate transport protein (PiT family) (part 2) [Bradyrhizobium sp. STM 3843]|nr:inorganic phosphate transporter [Bradyrhizobium sp. STM 3843]CCE07781.1 fragment of putative low-affinity inorganic phosphate transport protein (PiT family) (part 2) [Bradyrhizobium sp. STM 3843]